jgi:hypothetical protein
MNNLIARRSQIVEAQFTGNLAQGQKYPFTQDPNISRKNIVIYGIEAYTDIDLNYTSSGNHVVYDGAEVSIVVTFVDANNVERIYQIPYNSLLASKNKGFIRMIKPFTIDLTKSYVQLTDTGYVGSGQCAVFNLYYTYEGE